MIIKGDMIMENNEQIPKTVFDKEYSTQWRREVKFLEDKGINYTYAKKHNKYPIIRYKYTKTPELFLALAEFYNQVRNEKTFKSIEKTVNSLTKGCIDIKKEDLTDAEKKLMDFQISESEVENIIKNDIQDNNLKDDTE